MTATILGLLVLTGVLTLFWRLRREVSETGDHIRQPKGWLKSEARIEEALRVADRHLPTARPGANVRLQYGKSGCLTMIRRKPRGGDGGYLARWEFWQPDEALARRLLEAGAEEVKRPGRDVLELRFGEDYLSFRKAMSDTFSGRKIETGNMHLTWNC